MPCDGKGPLDLPVSVNWSRFFQRFSAAIMSLLGNGHSHFRTAGSQVARRVAGGAARILDEQQVLNAAHNESQLKSAQRHLQRAGSSCANERV